MTVGRIAHLRRLMALTLSLSLLSAAWAVNVQPASAADTELQAATTTSTFRVYAHREGLVGRTTANGHVIQENDHFVALPCVCALSKRDGQEFQVKIEYKGKSTIAPVWDVGPWNIDDNYWDPPQERKWQGIPQGVPEAAAAYYNRYNEGLDGKKRPVRSPAGIDIADGTFWHDLGMTDSDWVTVTFLWLTPGSGARALAPAQQELPPLPEGYQDIPTVIYGQRPPLDPVAPRTTGNYTYIQETKHNVPEPLIQFWYQNGGWRNLGLPITELFREVYADGSTRIVQYFERSILELNLPRTADLPLVTSALIGYSTWAPPEARAHVAPFHNSDNFWYFPETGHSLGNGFKHHWVKYGGLTAFGYPITEEYTGTTPDGRKYVGQIFERARFEWWADKAGTHEEITHGLLVVELLRQAGWVK